MFTMKPLILQIFTMIALVITADGESDAGGSSISSSISCFQKAAMEIFIPCLGAQTAKDNIGSKITEFFGLEEKPKECGSVTNKCLGKIMEKFGECYNGHSEPHEESRFNIMEGAINAGTAYLCKDDGKANTELQQDENCKSGKFMCMSSLFFNPPTFDSEGCKKLRNHFDDCKTKSECKGENANTYGEYLDIVLDSTPCKIVTTTTEIPSTTPIIDFRKLGKELLAGLTSSVAEKIVGASTMTLLSSVLVVLF